MSEAADLWVPDDTGVSEPVLRTVQLQVCEPCIERQGDECHTPGCTFWLHSVADIPAAIDLGVVVS